ncbi:MAG: agmatine deiminase family protein [Saprospiraceae bacterium]|nr:agmatine deiminase family protein [Saprospiraceae bacterium]
MLKTIKLISILLFCHFSLILQSQDLPNYMTEAEKALMPSYLQSISSKGFTSPPNSPLRAPGEWEEIDALTITWTSYKPVLTQIVKYAQLECRVIIICSDSNSVKSYLTNNGVTAVNVDYIETAFNSVWIRDYGAQSVYTNDVDSLILIDWIYNRPRYDDDTIPQQLAQYLGLPIYQTTSAPYSLVNTGGNFFSDGFGTAFSSNLILDENPGISTSKVDSIIQAFMGINNFVHMTNLPYDGIHHIDMHMKLLDEETLLVGQYPQGISDGPQIEANLQYVLSNFNSVFGTPYKVVRIPMPPDNTYSYKYPNQGGDYLTYTNGVFVNKTYIVPTYYEQYDTTALRILKESLPAYKVIGINCSSTIPASGAIHCITNSIASYDPLLISHQELDAMYGVKNPGYVEARIQHRSGISEARVYFRTDTLMAWDSLNMFFADTINNIWQSQAFPMGIGQPTKFDYFIKAKSNSGKQQVRPITAPEGYWSFMVYPGAVENLTKKDLKFNPAYPNPSKGITCIPVESQDIVQANISIYDIYGRKIENIFTGNIPKGKSNYFVNTINFSSGTYIIKLSTEDSIKTQKLIVK